MTIPLQAKFLALVISLFITYEAKSNDEALNEEDKKRFDCIAKYIDDDFKKREKQIIHRACEKLISKNERKQKIAECTLKEVGKHSLAVLIVKQNDCIHHFMHHKYE
tara:strand:+ start:346 stop:666 length:321 start_codon:yes stop_codon:yes gene_type:complete